MKKFLLGLIIGLSLTAIKISADESQQVNLDTKFNDTLHIYNDDNLELRFSENIYNINNDKIGEEFYFMTTTDNKITLEQDNDNHNLFYLSIVNNVK